MKIKIKLLKLSTRKTLWAYAFLLLPLLFFLGVRIIPTLQAFQMSLYNWHVQPEQRTFVGLANYARMLTDTRLHQAFRNMLWYGILGVPAQLILGLVVGLMLHSIRKFRGFFRAVFFAPYVAPAVAVAWVWSLLLSPHLGIVNQVLYYLGFEPQPFMTSPSQALPTVTSVVVWQFLGFHVLLFLAGLESIPRDYYEAAQIDGANRWQTFRYITLPLLNPTIVVSLVMATAAPSTGMLQLFTQVMNLKFDDPGGPLGSTLTVVLYTYQRAFQAYDMGYAAAIVVVLFVILLITSLLQIRLTSREVEY